MAKEKAKKPADPIEEMSEIEVGAPEPQDVTTGVAEVSPPPAPAAGGTATFSAPLGEVPDGAYAGRHVETRLDRAQALTLRRLLVGLRRRNDELRNGRPIVTPGDAIRWLLEQVGA